MTTTKKTQTKSKELTFNEKLNLAIEEVEKMEGLKLEGGNYTTVAQRLKVLRKIFGFDIKVANTLKFYDGTQCQFETRIYIKQDGAWEGIANGYSSERRNDNAYTATSLMEIAETSAVGRALAFLGLFGSNIASKDEVDGKKEQSKENKKTTKKVNFEKQSELLINQIKNILIESEGIDEDQILKKYNKKDLKELSTSQLKETIDILNALQLDDIPL